jgi:D-hydroxyproline dehydrogenase subunit alpha
VRVTLAAARARAEQPFRTSVTGEPRAPLCGMGVCHECRVTVGGNAHQLACMIPDGLPDREPLDHPPLDHPPLDRKPLDRKPLDRDSPDRDSPDREPRARLREERCDVLVVGGGPAGLAAARAARAAGADVLLLDEHPALGGPIYRALDQPPQRYALLRGPAEPDLADQPPQRYALLRGPAEPDLADQPPQRYALLRGPAEPDLADQPPQRYALLRGPAEPDLADQPPQRYALPRGPAEPDLADQPPQRYALLRGPAEPDLASPWPAPPRVAARTRVVAALGDGVLAEDDAGALVVRYRALVLAPGARELLLPFPGWTLPGVFGAGGLQLLAKGGWPVAGRRVLVGGTGPLLRAAAAGLRKLGARIAGIAELAPAGRVARFGVRLVAHPGKLVQAAALSASLAGVPVWSRARIVRAHGDQRVTAATVEIAGRARTIDCDLIAVGFGLVPCIELPLLFGCAVADGGVIVDERCATSVAGVWCAGEATGIGGIDKAIVEGEIAGAAAAGRAPEPRLMRRRRRAIAFADALAACFPAPADWAGVLDDDTIVCRCEDVRWRALRDTTDPRAAKLHTRAGMGACQGRICGPALAVLRGFSHGTIRPPVSPARLETLTSQ